jgi:predicted DNA repair protein MutK
VPHGVHDLAEEIARGFGRMDGVVSWLTNAIAASILGMVIGGVIVVIVRQFTKHPEELIID